MTQSQIFCFFWNPQSMLVTAIYTFLGISLGVDELHAKMWEHVKLIFFEENFKIEFLKIRAGFRKIAPQEVEYFQFASFWRKNCISAIFGQSCQLFDFWNFQLPARTRNGRKTSFAPKCVKLKIINFWRFEFSKSVVSFQKFWKN
jgi:hypothetical protein